MAAVLLPQGSLRRGQSAQSVASMPSSSPTATTAKSALSYLSTATSSFQTPVSSPVNLQRSTSSQSGGMMFTTISGGALPWATSPDPALTPQGAGSIRWKPKLQQSTSNVGPSEATAKTADAAETKDKSAPPELKKSMSEEVNGEQEDSPNTKAMKQRAMVPAPLTDVGEEAPTKASTSVVSSVRGSYPPGFTPSSKTSMPAYSPLHFPPGFTPSFHLSGGRSTTISGARSPVSSGQIPAQSPIKSTVPRTSPVSSPSACRTPGGALSAKPTYGKEMLLLQRGLLQQKRRLAGPAASPVAAQYASVQWPPPGISYEMVEKEKKENDKKKEKTIATAASGSAPAVSKPVPVPAVSQTVTAPTVVAPRVVKPPVRSGSFSEQAVMFGSVALPSPSAVEMSSGCFEQPQMTLTRELSGLNATAQPWSPSSATLQAPTMSVELDPSPWAFPPQMASMHIPAMPFMDPNGIHLAAMAEANMQMSLEQDVVFWKGSGTAGQGMSQAPRQGFHKGGGKGKKSYPKAAVRPTWKAKGGDMPAPR